MQLAMSNKRIKWSYKTPLTEAEVQNIAKEILFEDLPLDNNVLTDIDNDDDNNVTIFLKMRCFLLRVVTGQTVSIVGQRNVEVKYENKTFKLPLVILDSFNKFTPLLDRNWLNVINP